MPKNFRQNRSGSAAIDETFTPQTGWEFLSFELEITTRPSTDEDVIVFVVRSEGATTELIRETPRDGLIAERYTLRRSVVQLENVRFTAGDTMRATFANTDGKDWNISMIFTEGDIL